MAASDVLFSDDWYLVINGLSFKCETSWLAQEASCLSSSIYLQPKTKLKKSFKNIPEAVAQTCTVKKVFLEVSQNSQENTCGRGSILIELQASVFNSLFPIIKVGLSPSKNIFGYLLDWKPFKSDEKCFLFHLKGSFSSQDILVFVTTFWSCWEKQLD